MQLQRRKVCVENDEYEREQQCLAKQIKHVVVLRNDLRGARSSYHRPMKPDFDTPLMWPSQMVTSQPIELLRMDHFYHLFSSLFYFWIIVVLFHVNISCIYIFKKKKRPYPRILCGSKPCSHPQNSFNAVRTLCPPHTFHTSLHMHGPTVSKARAMPTN